jgi:hypothetical protein
MVSRASGDEQAIDPPPSSPAIDAAVTALARLEEGQTLIVDLDETLWLRNSTEAYLASIRPRWLVGSVLIALEIFPFWRFFGGDHETAEDWLRVVVCTSLFPWALPMWSRRARRIGPHHLNHPLADSIRARSRPGPLLVATRGFEPIVRPLVASFGLPPHDLVACRLWRGRRDRALGKDAMVVERIGVDAAASSAVITDSDADRALLDRCRLPVLHTWSAARYERAPHVYVPFSYTQLYKRSDQRYVYHIILGRDLLVWIAATFTVSKAPLGMHLVGLVLLLISLWCVYEIGYLENDRVAERYEADPVLPDRPLPGARFALAAWVWGLLVGVAGAAFVRPDEVPLAVLSWIGVLIGLRVGFGIYNNLDKGTRPVLYVGLQAVRLLAPLALVSVSVPGLVGMLILIWSRSMLYAVYRVMAGSWVFVPHELINLAQLCIAFVVLWRVGVALDPVVVGVFLGLFVNFARGEARLMLRDTHLIRTAPRLRRVPEVLPTVIAADADGALE